MADFLLELLSEEIPARMQEKASADLARLFEAEIAKAGLTAEAVQTYATPRRLALIARGLPAATEAVSEETKGPKSSAPPQALEGFLRKTGLTREQLTERDGILFAVIEKSGRATADVLAEAIPAIVAAFPWPKSMRWGPASASTASLRWVRPLQGIVALLGSDVVEFEIDGIASGAATLGHRFHHPGIITIGSAADYAEKLRTCHVILDPAERRGIIEGGARAIAEARGLHVIPDPGLVAENAGLTEWPTPLLGDFDPAFLDVPREVIQLTMRTNQKYFACVDADGKLAPNFICTANIVAADGGTAIVAGNRKVLAARLSDAKFFWEQDLKIKLEDQAEKLASIVFHEKLGTVAEKVERVAELARWLVELGIVGGSIPSSATITLANKAEQAARLAKADLVTGMVGEFPELQGIVGGYYADAEGLGLEIAHAIRDHYKPVGQSDDIPTEPVTVAVSLADKLDTLAGFFAVGLIPTGSKDPFALRRLMIGIINIVRASAIRLPFYEAVQKARNLVLATLSQDRWVISADDADEINPRLLGPDDSEWAGLLYIYPTDASRYSSDYDREELVLSDQYSEKKNPPIKFGSEDSVADELKDFLLDRLRVRLREQGLRHDIIESIIPRPPGEIDLEWLIKEVGDSLLGLQPANFGTAFRPSDQIVAIEQGAAALDKIMSTSSGQDALYVYRRASKILEGATIPSDSKDAVEIGASEETMALARWVEGLENEITSALACRDFTFAVGSIARGRGPIDAFFDSVTVNDVDPAKRAARLGLLARIRGAVHRVADFSKIEG